MTQTFLLGRAIFFNYMLIHNMTLVVLGFELLKISQRKKYHSPSLAQHPDHRYPHILMRPDGSGSPTGNPTQLLANSRLSAAVLQPSSENCAAVINRPLWLCSFYYYTVFYLRLNHNLVN